MLKDFVRIFSNFHDGTMPKSPIFSFLQGPLSQARKAGRPIQIHRDNSIICENSIGICVTRY
ncbi:MAG: hypothetical protein BAJATHORv1_120050 [Candidatus Thorarchaeota archaeon]|nr:MAG: hypothetical protein BAJATHORv1_120050 [Candidatus Thorarchaeota archaeon]